MYKKPRRPKPVTELEKICYLVDQKWEFSLWKQLVSLATRKNKTDLSERYFWKMKNYAKEFRAHHDGFKSPELAVTDCVEKMKEYIK